MSMRTDTLLVIPSLNVGLSSDGRVRLTEKFVSGMQMYVNHWGDRVAMLAQPDPAKGSGNLDDVWMSPGELPFEVTVADFNSEQAMASMARAAVVQGGTDHRLNLWPELCRAQGVKYVLVSEYTLKTRWQIIDAEGLNPVVAWRRKAWAWRQERANLRAVKASSAVHCNGTPTFEAYSPLNESTLLYFDSRVEADMLPESSRLESTKPWSAQHPMRLVFSGRLNAMKGADHLVLVANALRDIGVPFVMDIYGDGPLVPSMKAAIAAYGLEHAVRLGGVLDFAKELMPTVREQADLFVCCHRQGDPSCTYLETMACGVPIVGYANEAFEGLMRRCSAGVSVPMDDFAGMADAIRRLSMDQPRLVRMAQQALSFAREHTFEAEFGKRLSHMRSLL